jgi:hypothetical protein
MNEIPLTNEAFLSCNLNDIFSGLAPRSYFDIFNRLDSHIKTLSDDMESQKAIMIVLSRVCLMRLVPSKGESQYKPYFVDGSKRSDLPSDFSENELSFFAGILDDIADNWVKARLCDLLWILKRPRNYIHAKAAIQCYLNAVNFDDGWNSEIGKFLVRAIHLSKSISSTDGKAAIELIFHTAFRNYSFEKAIIILRISEIISDEWPVESFQKLAADTCALIGDEYLTIRNTFNARAYFDRASILYSQLKLEDEAASVRIKSADCFVDDAEKQKHSGSQSYLASAHFYECAIHKLREIPNRIRRQRGIEDKILELHNKLREAGQNGIDEMATISSGSIDIKEYVLASQKAVTGKPTIEAMRIFASLQNYPKLDELKDQATQQISDFPFSRLFGRTYRSDDGRTVAKRPGTGPSADPDSLIRAEMIENHIFCIDIAVRASIIPALTVLRNEHTLEEYDFRRIAGSSPFVPSDKVELVALGLYHGFNGDFVSAIHILAPQIEACLRYHLRTRGIKTSVLDSSGIETENGMSTLIECPETSEILGPGLTFELRCLFTDANGTNIRNNVAHGLIGYGESQSTPVIYSWWLILKVVFNAYWSALMASQLQDADPKQPE